jgi:4-hydroxy-tetrahydrodipicolinate synthase
MTDDTAGGKRYSTLVVSLTPFDEDGGLDVGAYRRHLRRMGDAGVGVYVGGSGSGEGYTLSHDETETVYRVAAQELRGRVPVRAMGVEPRSSRELVELAKLARDSGLEAMQVYSVDMGHGIRPTAAELERYFSDVVSAVEMPVVISTHFSVGYLVPLDVLERLLDRFEHVQGINCTAQDIPYVVSVIERFAHRVEVHVGAPDQALVCLMLGGHGFLSAEANLAPLLCASVVTRYEAGEADRLEDAFVTLVRLHARGSRFWGLGGITGMKAALRQLNLPGGHTRPPRLSLDADAEEELAALLADLDIARLEGLDASPR